MKKLSIIGILLLAIISSYSQNFTAHTDLEGLPDNWVNGIAVDNNNVKWAATQSGVASFNGTTWTVYTTVDGLLNNDAKCIAIDSAQNVWVGFDYGVCMFDGTSWVSYTDADGLVNNGVTYIAADYDGNVWFATYGGLSKFDGTSWESYTLANGLLTELLNYIACKEAGEIWIGTFADGFMKFDGTTFTIFNTDNGLIDNTVTAIAFDASDNIWISTFYGLSVFDASENWQINYTVVDGMYYSMSRALLLDDYGDMWVGIYADYVYEGGVSKFTGTEWITYTEANGITGVIIKRLAKDINGNIWIATGDGLTEIDLSVSTPQITHYTHLNIFPNPSNDFVNISFDSNCNTISISDISGNTIAKISETTKYLDVRNLSSGIYLLNYFENNLPKTQKLIVY